MNAPLDPKRTVAELRELRQLTSDENGAQRVAFTKTWLNARSWLRKKLEALPVEVHVDEAGNLWATLKGESDRELLIGGHMDSVPNGGWLDGCLNVLAGVEILRRLSAQYGGKPPVTVRLVDWADEEGARFGKSLFGSSACSGTLDLELARDLKDRDGIGLPDALREVGIDFENVKNSGRELKTRAPIWNCTLNRVPVLLELGLPLGAVLGTFGVERHALTFHGQAAHSGSTPMNRRRDAFLAAARMSPETYRIAEKNGGVCTIGSCTTKPGIVTSVVEDCRITLDQRHLDAAALARMLREAGDAAARFAREGAVSVCLGPNLGDRADPLRRGSRKTLRGLDPRNVRRGPPVAVGPLHDAAEMARAGIPTAMMFVQSLHGISHNKIEEHPGGAPRAVRPGVRPPGRKGAEMGQRCPLTSSSASGVTP